MTREKVIENLKANDMCKAYLVAEEAYKLLEKDDVCMRTTTTILESVRNDIVQALADIKKMMEDTGCLQ